MSLIDFALTTSRQTRLVFSGKTSLIGEGGKTVKPLTVLEEIVKVVATGLTRIDCLKCPDNTPLISEIANDVSQMCSVETRQRAYFLTKNIIISVLKSDQHLLERRIARAVTLLQNASFV